MMPAEILLALHALGPGSQIERDVKTGATICLIDAGHVLTAWAAREERLRKAWEAYRKSNRPGYGPAFDALAKELEWQP